MTDDELTGAGRLFKHIADPPTGGPWTHTHTPTDPYEADSRARLGAAMRDLVEQLLAPFERLARWLMGRRAGRR